MTADDLRTRLKALVEEWRWNARNERIGWPEAAGLLYAADRLEDAILNSPEIPDGCASLLAESEPEPRFSDVTATRCLRHATIPPTILPPASQECGLCMREEGVLVGRSGQRPELAWLIESRLTPSPTWWTGSDWTGDSLKAVRFCRKQDAEAALATLPDKHVCFTSEHQWGFGGSEPEPCAGWRHCEHDGEDGHIACDVLCADCGMHRDAHPDCEAEAKLPLGHEFLEHASGPERDCTLYQKCHYIGGPGLCGQPRSAHEPQP